MGRLARAAVSRRGRGPPIRPRSDIPAQALSTAGSPFMPGRVYRVDGRRDDADEPAEGAIHDRGRSCVVPCMGRILMQAMISRPRNSLPQATRRSKPWASGSSIRSGATQVWKLIGQKVARARSRFSAGRRRASVVILFGDLVPIPREFFAGKMQLGLFNGIYDRDHPDRAMYRELAVATDEFNSTFLVPNAARGSRRNAREAHHTSAHQDR